jgi:hypothetical protein
VNLTCVLIVILLAPYPSFEHVRYALQIRYSVARETVVLQSIHRIRCEGRANMIRWRGSKTREYILCYTQIFYIK